MSFEDTNCPCGDRKPPDTMFCDACMDVLKSRPEMKTLVSDQPITSRRHAAIVLLALSRGRKRNANLTGSLKPGKGSNAD